MSEARDTDSPAGTGAATSASGVDRLLGWAEIAAIALPCLWLAWGALSVRVELYDGFDSICNTRFLLGDSDILVAHRCPLTSFLLVPAHLAAKALSFHARDVRPYHVSMAFLQAAYLVGVFLLLRRRAPDRVAGLVAFAVGILNFVFFSFAPFVDHDLYPGGILLLMLLAADAYWRRPGWRSWTLLVVLGASAALVKQTYGVFWVMILAAGAWRAVSTQAGGDRRAASKAWLCLGAGAVASAAVYWVVMGWVLSGWIPDEPALLRPLRQITRLLQRHDDVAYHVPVWLYVRNMGFYGFLTTFLIVPGVVMGLRSRDALQRSVALSWLIGFVVLHIVSIRAVRYMAFLMPLSALLIAPPIAWVFAKRRYVPGLLAVLLVDVGLAVNEASRLREPFYRESMLDQFLEPLDDPDSPPSRIFTTDTKLCVMPARNTPFAACLYHRLFHFRWYHIRAFGPDSVPVQLVSSDAQLSTMAADDPDSALVFANQVLQYPASLFPGPPQRLNEFAMHCCRAADLAVQWTDGTTDTNADRAAALSVETHEGRDAVVLRCPQLSGAADTFLFPCLTEPSTEQAWPLVPLGDGRYEVAGLTKADTAQGHARFRVRGYRTERLVTAATGRPGVELFSTEQRVSDDGTAAAESGCGYYMLYWLAYVLSTLVALRLWRKMRLTGWKQLVTGNTGVLAFLMGFAFLAGEGYFLFVYDTTDTFGFTRTSRRWEARHVSRNRLGCRDGPAPRATGAPGELRIGVLGDSFTFGQGIDDPRDRFTDLLESRLPAELGHPIVVYNLSQLGWDTGDHIFACKHLTEELDLDVVLLAYTMNDLRDLTPQASALYKIEERRPGWMRTLSRASLLLDFMLARLTVLNVADETGFAFFADAYADEETWGTQRRRLASVVSSVDNTKTELRAVIFPMLGEEWPEYSLGNAHQQVGAAFTELGVGTLDMLSVWRKHPVRSLWVNRFDPHPNEKAHALAADAICQWLR